MDDSAFSLPDHLAPKADPALIRGDERHFDALESSLTDAISTLRDQLDSARRAPVRAGQAVLDRDLEIHRLTARLRTLQRFGRNLCLGRMVPAGGSEPTYVGRLGLTDAAGRRLLLDWRSPAAEPFFGATHADPMGLISRRRYRWTRDHITDYWDEVFVGLEGLEGRAALDDQSAFLAGLGASRSPRMQDVLGTIAADQDAIIRAGSRGALVVDGGPGTGKTVVALHRAAYLLYSDPRLADRRQGGILFIGPHEPYLAYVADVLPSLGEEGVQTCTVRDLVGEGATASVETDPQVSRWKASAEVEVVVEAAVRFYEQPPTATMLVATPWADVPFSGDDWAEAFATPDPGSAHNEARDQVWEAVIGILADKHDEDVPLDLLRRSLHGDAALTAAFDRSWPLLEATDLVADLWSVPAYLTMCAPGTARADARALRRQDPYAWTVDDLPFLDAARQRLGDPAASRRRRRQEATMAAEHDRMAAVIERLIEADDGEGLVTSLRQPDLQDVLVDEAALPARGPDLLAGPFGHIVVDEAQELTDAQWQMLLVRCPSRSFTVVGDRAQARHGFGESWRERLGRVGFDRIAEATLSVNYRTPEEVMAEAEPVIRAAVPDANVPISIRSSGLPVEHRTIGDLGEVVETWLAEHPEGTACVIAVSEVEGLPPSTRVRWSTPELTKGLEFDLVVLIDPAGFGGGIEGAVDRYIAMTRATSRLVVLTTVPSEGAGRERIALPAVL